MEQFERKAIVVGISGASSSGKTTLARLLRDIFPNTFVLHEDDFYKPEKDIPITDGILDWDCSEALVIPDIIKSLGSVRKTGILLPSFDSKEDRNDVGKCPVSDALIDELKAEVDDWIQPGHPGHGIFTTSQSILRLRLCIFDGFLLYSPSMAAVQKYIDIKFFLRVGYAKAKARREARSGYATIEGFWEDPPGYVDKIVWPNYVKDHKWMFEGGVVEGRLKKDIMKEWNIKTQMDKGSDVEFETTLRWAVDTLMKELEILAGS